MCEMITEIPISTLECSSTLKTRLENLSLQFQYQYNEQPTFFVRVPGRVNLIGEHIDYCGYSVCPMAIEQDILIAAFKTNDNTLWLKNVNPKYDAFHCNDFNGISKLTLDDSVNEPGWHKYFLCGVKGALEFIIKENKSVGLMVLVCGNIPPSAGLSSSSAIVSAAVLATLYTSQVNLTKTEMANISMKSERYIGTQGGGMDQAIAFLGEMGYAKMIGFNPLRTTDIVLPANAVFIIAHSLVSHNKASTGDFNMRVMECNLAAQIIAKQENIEWKQVHKLQDIQNKLGKSLDEMISIVSLYLHEQPYFLSEVCEILQMNANDLETIHHITYPNWSQRLKLKQRALHVFQEAKRVVAFRQINEDSSMSDNEKIKRLGCILSASHSSLQNLYECSHPKIDALVKTSIECGALGARLTGAGWGGCVVSVTTRNQAEAYLEMLHKKFYSEYSEESEFNIEKYVFVTEPKQGAAIYIP